MNPIYLDYNATTPLAPEVIEAMKPFIDEHFGNPSSNHFFGKKTKDAIELARVQVAVLLNCESSEIIFTSGGTESNNYALKGFAYANKHRGNHIITSQIEHPAIIEVCKFLEKNGLEISYLPVDKYGILNPIDVENAITSKTILVSVMHANNEIGTIQPLQEISEIINQRNICFHTDAAQSIGKIQADVVKLGVDMLSIADISSMLPKELGLCM